MKNFLLMVLSFMGLSLMVLFVSYKFGFPQGTSLLYGLLTMMLTSIIGMTIYARNELRDEELEKLYERNNKDRKPFTLLVMPIVIITLILSGISYIFDPALLKAYILLSAMVAGVIVFSFYAHYRFKDEKPTVAKSSSLQDYCTYSAKALGYTSKE